jgi:hypothetical protein
MDKPPVRCWIEKNQNSNSDQSRKTDRSIKSPCRFFLGPDSTLIRSGELRQRQSSKKDTNPVRLGGSVQLDLYHP